MSSSWADDAARLIAAEGAVALVTVVRALGSAPRDAGVRMLVTATGGAGTIGGGNLEFIAMAQARKLLADAAHTFLQQDYPLGPLTAQCCGGRVALLIEKLDAESLPWLADVAACARDGMYRVTRRVTGETLARTVTAAPGASAGVDLRDTAGLPLASAARTWAVMEEVIAPLGPVVLLFGAGHVGRALAPLLAGLSFDLRWIDARPEMEDLPGIDVIRTDPAACAAEAPQGAFFVVMTHSHDLDYALVRAALSRCDAAYVGLIGSATKRQRFLSRLANDGVADAERRLTCPIGDFGVRDKAPAAIAACVAVELLQARERLAARAFT